MRTNRRIGSLVLWKEMKLACDVKLQLGGKTTTSPSYFEFSLAVMKFQYVSKGPSKNRNTLLGGAFTYYYVDHWASFLSSFIIICSTIPLLPFLLISSYILLLPTFIPQASFSLPTENVLNGRR